jgi:micrococcal nuclease
MLRVTPAIGALASLAYLALPGVAPGLEGSVKCTIERVTDGDTIRCGGERVRLLLIDAPEVDQGPFGRAAQAFLEAILPVGSEARMTYDVERRDRYDRMLAYVYRPDGRMANHMMARQGFAVPLVVPPNVRHVESIRAAADSARESGLGLWAVEAFACLPETFRDGLCGTTPIGGEPPLLLHAVSVTRGIGDCDPSYPDVCIPPPPPDLDCGDIRHRRFRVQGRDPHRFDGDNDGIGCESR